MPPAPTSYPGKRLLALQCKWQECDKTLALPVQDYQDFSEHVFGHISNYLTDVGFSQHGIVNHAELSFVTHWTCKWSECSWGVVGNPDEFTRHVLFHAYHTKLKCLGAFAVILEGLRQCTFDVETSDLLPDMSEPFMCRWEGCGMQFLCPDKFYRHVDLHGQAAHREDVLVTTGEKVKPEVTVSNEEELAGLKVQKMTQSVCRWEGCSYLARDPWKVKEHCRIHTGEKLLACPSCGLFFANKTKFADHLIRQDTAQYEHYQCSHCLTRCASERLLRDHMRHHVNHVKCPHCDMTCPNPSTLRSHLKFKHSLDRPFKCSMCNYSCKTKYDLARHEGSVHFDRRFHCEQEGCSFECRYAAALRSHVRSVHQGIGPQQYMCHICGKKLSRGSLLTKHLKKEHCFSWPSGHSRFRYKLDEDGYYRLQMVRFESAELTEQLSRENPDIDGYRGSLEPGDNSVPCDVNEKGNSPTAEVPHIVTEVLPSAACTQPDNMPQNQDVGTTDSTNEDTSEAVSVSLNARYEKLLRLYEMARDDENSTFDSMEEERESGTSEVLNYPLESDYQDPCNSNGSKRKSRSAIKSPKKLKTPN